MNIVGMYILISKYQKTNLALAFFVAKMLQKTVPSGIIHLIKKYI